MEQEKLGWLGIAWNLFWITVLLVSIPLAFWAYSASDDPFAIKLLSVFGVITGSTATLYQVYMKKPDGFLRAVKHEFFITRKSISGAAVWIVNRNRENIEEVTKQQTEEIKSHQAEGFSSLEKKITNVRSVSFGLELLQISHWNFVSGQNQFICVDDASWNIVQKRQTNRTFSEPWVDNMYRPDKTIEVFRVVLRRNKTEVQDILFLELDGARYTMPLPKKDGPNTYYYCANGFEHMMFNIVRQIYGLNDELKDLAEQGQIEWRQC
jgi:hypothetical protein